VVLQDEALRRAAEQHFAHFVGIDAGGFRKRDRLRHARERRRNDELVAGFRQLAGARGAKVHVCLADRFEHRHAGFDSFRLAAEHAG
jgi:hypothetical protein